MRQRNKLITAPAAEPITLDEAKAHARIEYPDDDQLVSSLITAARLVCEQQTRRAFIHQAWETYLDGWGWDQGYNPAFYGAYIPQIAGYPWTPFAAIQVDNPDLVSVASITYVDPAGDVQTLDPSAYQVEPGAPGLIHPAYGTSWPSARSTPGAITIAYLAGYGPDPADVPEYIKAAIKMMVAELYEQREMTAAQAYECNPIYGVLLAPANWGDYQ